MYNAIKDNTSIPSFTIVGFQEGIMKFPQIITEIQRRNNTKAIIQMPFLSIKHCMTKAINDNESTVALTLERFHDGIRKFPQMNRLPPRKSNATPMTQNQSYFILQKTVNANRDNNRGDNFMISSLNEGIRKFPHIIMDIQSSRNERPIPKYIFAFVIML